MKRNPDELREMVLRHVERNNDTLSDPDKLTSLVRGWWKKQFQNVRQTQEYALAKLLIVNLDRPSEGLHIATWLPKSPSAEFEKAELGLYIGDFILYVYRHGEKAWFPLTRIEEVVASLAHDYTGPPLCPFLNDLIGEAIATHVNASAVAADRVLEQQRAEERIRQATAKSTTEIADPPNIQTC